MEGHQIKIILFVIIGAGTVVYYRIRNWRSKSKGKLNVERCKVDIEYAKSLAASLDTEYSSLKTSIDNFKKHLKLLNETKVGNTTILLAKEINRNEYLLITWTEKTDYNITSTGKMGNLNKVEQINYLLLFDEAKSKMIGFSDSYNNISEKNLRTTFLQTLFQMINNNAAEINQPA